MMELQGSDVGVEDHSLRQHDKLVCELELSIDREAYSLAQADVYAYWAQIAVIANALCTQVSESPVAVRIV